MPSGPVDGTPSPEEDRDLNRLRLAARLLGFLRANGRPVDPFVGRLREAEKAFRDGDRAKGRRLVDEVTTEAERLLDAGGHPSEPTP